MADRKGPETKEARVRKSVRLAETPEHPLCAAGQAGLSSVRSDTKPRPSFGASDVLEKAGHQVH